MTIAFLFPGQGAQSEGLLHHLPQHAEVTRTIEEASDVLGVDIAGLDNSEALHSTAAVQPALLIAGVATARALMAEHVHPAAVAGMSIGAFGAAVTCGTLSFADALPLVRLRGELMQAAFPSGYRPRGHRGPRRSFTWKASWNGSGQQSSRSTFPTSTRLGRSSSPGAMRRSMR